MSVTCASAVLVLIRWHYYTLGVYISCFLKKERDIDQGILSFVLSFFGLDKQNILKKTSLNHQA